MAAYLFLTLCIASAFLSPAPALMAGIAFALPLPQALLKGISVTSHTLLSVTLFLIGSTLSLKAIKKTGIRPVLLGIALWIIISVVSLIVIR